MRTPMTLPPGPPESAWLQVWRYFRDPHAFFGRCAREYGDAFTMRYPGSPPLVVFTHPSAVKELFTADPDALRAGEANAILRNVVGDYSLFVTDGARHDQDRRGVMGLFPGGGWAALANAAARGVRSFPHGFPFRVHTHLELITVDLIVGLLFAASPASILEELRSAILEFSRLAVGPGSTFAAMIIPPRAARTLSSVTPASRVLLAQRELRRIVLGEIRRRRRATTSHGDVVASLMAARDDRVPLSDEQVRDQTITLILAGHETSATTLAWTVHHLASHDAIQTKLRTEVSAGDVEKWVLLDSVLKETLRMTPVVPVIPRRVARPLQIGGYALPEGVTVAVSPYLTQHREDLWERPWIFNPTRFVGRRIDPYSFFPFGGGGRRCLGMAFALTLMKAVLSEMVRHRAWDHSEGVRAGHERRGLLVAPSRELAIVARER